MQHSLQKENASPVVIVLPFVGNRVLMQLRDPKPSILFPGKWGFFGGAVEKGEEPLETARRELMEEIGFYSKEIKHLETTHLPELGNILSYSFGCPLTISLKEIKLNEGADFGLFTLDEVITQKLYSLRMKKEFPVIPSPYVTAIIKKLFACLEKNH